MPLRKKDIQIYYASLKVEIEKWFEKQEANPKGNPNFFGHYRRIYFEKMNDYFFITEKLSGGNKYART